MRPVVPGGFLLAVEGVDGLGKTTVAALLAQFCGERGLLCALSKEPTGIGPGRQLRDSARTGRGSVEAELALFLQDRIEHAARTIRPALAAGAVVILDRYYWSTAAYQGARGVEPHGIIAANEAAVPRPDLVLLLDGPAEAGLDRVRRRGDEPNEFEKIAALERARTIFSELQAVHGGFSARLDATPPLREVHAAAERHFRAALVAAIERHQPDAAARAMLLGLIDA